MASRRAANDQVRYAVAVKSNCPVTEILTKVALPLVTTDQAEIYVVRATTAEVHLHLAGAYSGCASVEFVKRHLLAPLVHEVYPKATLIVSSGSPLPRDAKRLEAA